MNQTQPVIHVGLPKTGSTFLQRRVFPTIPNADYHSSCDGSLPDELSWAYRINGPWLANHISREIRREKLENIFENEKRLVLKHSEQSAVSSQQRLDSFSLISSEGLVGSSPDPMLNADLCASLIKLLYPTAKIILVLRRQDTWCESIYRQLIFSEDRYRCFIPFEKFFDLEDCGLGRVPAGVLAWDQLVNIYYRVFGKSNVCVLPFELMCDDPEAFVSALTDFVETEIPQGVPFNIRENEAPVGNIYSRGSLMQRFRKVLGGVRDGKQRAYFELNGLIEDGRSIFKYEVQKYQSPRPEVLGSILQRYKESNMRLAEICDIEFGAYGYY